MYHIIEGLTYSLYGDNDEKLFEIKLDQDIGGDQVVITTKNEVYAGPIRLISFSEIAKS